MPKGRVLTAAEREEIARMHEAGASAREIGKKLSRSKTVVLNFLKNPAQYAQIKRSGRKRALSGDDERRLYAALFQQKPSSSSALVELQAPVVAQAGSLFASDVSGGDAQTAMETVAVAVQAEAQREQAAALPDMKKSAEQIKKEFNVPLSTRRIQQLLSEWRREARRAQDRQQQVQQAAPAPSTAARVAVDGSDGCAIETVARESHPGNSTESASVAEAVDQPLAATGEPGEGVAEAAMGGDAPPMNQDSHPGPVESSYLAEPDQQTTPQDALPPELQQAGAIVVESAATGENAVTPAPASPAVSAIEV